MCACSSSRSSTATLGKIVIAPALCCVRWWPPVDSAEKPSRVFTAMSSTQVQLKTEGSHATVTFRTEGALNILSADVLHSFGAVIARIKKDPRIRTAVIQAEGKVF